MMVLLFAVFFSGGGVVRRGDCVPPLALMRLLGGRIRLDELGEYRIPSFPVTYDIG